MKNKYIIIAMIGLLLLSVMPASVLAKTERTTIQDEILYDILIDRFNNGNKKLNEEVDIEDPLTYNGGDFQGITMRLDHIEKYGFTTISLSSVMANAKRGYHGYWVEDFYAVEPQFGSDVDLKNVIKQAHDKDMKVVLELVTNYVAKTSPLVSEPGKESWFKEVTVDSTEATAWLDEVYVLDQDNEEVQAYLIDVAKHWMTEFDIDGYKLQAADQSSPQFLEKLTNEIKAINPDFYVIANVLEDGKDNRNLYDYNIDAVENTLMLDAMNNTFTTLGAPIQALFEQWQENADPRDVLLIDNKNVARYSNNLGENNRNRETLWKMALAYMYITPGVPMIYQGSEVPMYGPGFPENQYLVDFTSAEPNMERVFFQIAAIRKAFPSLVEGDFEQIKVDRGMSLFKRTLGDESVFVAINNDSESRVVSIDGIDEDMQLRGLVYDDTVRVNKDGAFIVGIDRESAEVFVVQEDTGYNLKLIGFAVGVFTIFGVALFILGKRQKQREKLAKV